MRNLRVFIYHNTLGQVALRRVYPAEEANWVAHVYVPYTKYGTCCPQQDLEYVRTLGLTVAPLAFMEARSRGPSVTRVRMGRLRVSSLPARDVSGTARHFSTEGWGPLNRAQRRAGGERKPKGDLARLRREQRKGWR